MKLRRTELQAQIESQEEEKNTLQREIEKLSYKLTRLNDSLSKRIAVRNEYDRTIADTETAYIKVHLFTVAFPLKLTYITVFVIFNYITDFREFAASIKHD